MASPEAEKTPSADFSEIRDAIGNLPAEQQESLAAWLRQLAAERAREKRIIRQNATTDQRVFFRSPALVWTFIGLIAFLVAEAAIFRQGWYNKYLEPQSSAGMVESYLFWLKHTLPTTAPEVMVLGDSRIAEGFSSRDADRVAGNKIHFWNFGMGGTSPRIWYYVLRDADPTRRRFRAIAMALDHYSDKDELDSRPNRLIDLNFIIGRLRLTDCPDFAASMVSREFKQKALAGCLFKGIPLRRDAQEFLLNVSDRIKRSKEWHNKGLFYTTDYLGREENLNGLSADFAQRTIVYPPGIDEQRRSSIEAMVMPAPAPQTGETTRYRELWLGRILDLYKDSPTRIIFFELPRAPLPRPEDRVPAAWLQSALKRPRPQVAALPQNTFRDLERPDVFFDGLHLNRVGRGIFSTRLAETIPPLLGIQMPGIQTPGLR
jgi:hypothetical protein